MSKKVVASALVIVGALCACATSGDKGVWQCGALPTHIELVYADSIDASWLAKRPADKSVRLFVFISSNAESDEFRTIQDRVIPIAERLSSSGLSTFVVLARANEAERETWSGLHTSGRASFLVIKDDTLAASMRKPSVDAALLLDAEGYVVWHGSPRHALFPIAVESALSNSKTGQ